MDENTINAGGAEDLKRLAEAINKVNSSLDAMGERDRVLATVSAQFEKMTQMISTSMSEILAVQNSAASRAESSAKVAAAKRLALEEAAWEKLIFTSNKANSKIETDQATAAARRLSADASAQMKALEQEVNAENRRAAALQAAMEKRDLIEYQQFGKVAAARTADYAQQMEVEVKWLAMLAGEKEKQLALEASFNAEVAKLENARVAARILDHEREQQIEAQWLANLAADHEKALALEATFNREVAKLGAARLAEQVSAAEKQRSLNTGFLTSGIGGQIATAEKAQVYSSLGGNAADKFGSAAASADIAALRRQYELLPQATRNATAGIAEHNAAMAEGHALARGLAGSLGGLWLTYGSLVPLAAGAALAASLKGVVTAGKEVEYQLKFVEALSGEAPSLDKFLGITEQTVVGIKDAAEGMRALSQNGLSARDSLKVLPDVLNLAVIGEMGVSAAALSATGVVSAFGLTLAGIGRASDIFAQAAASSNTSVQGMTEAMKQASTVAAVYGVSIEEVAAAQGTLAKVNITGTAAGTAYTNILTNLYAPSAKATKALEELGVKTAENDGTLKNSTKLLSELRDALGKYNDAAQATFYKDIFSTRGAKGASVLLDNWDSYIEKVEAAKNATGFAGEAVAKLEDSVEGASKRLQNSFGATLVKAFEPVAPALQALVLHLAEIAGSTGAIKTLTNLAETVLSLTQFVLDHASAIATMVGVYAGVSSITAIWTAVAGAMKTYTAASVVAGTATAALRTEAALLMASLGPIALAVTAATLAWQIFGSETTPMVESADQKLRNSIDANIEYLKRETKALEERNAARDAPSSGPSVGSDADKLVGQLQSQYDQLKKTYEDNGGERSGRPKNLDVNYQNMIAKEKELNDARTKAIEQMTISSNLAVGKEIENDANEKQRVLDQIQRLVDKGGVAKTLAGEMVAADAQGNSASRQFATDQQKLFDKVKNGTIDAKQGVIELTAAQRTYSSMLESRAPKEDKKAANDQLKAELEKIQLAKQLLDVKQKTEAMESQAANRAGTLGDVGLLEAQNKLAKEKVQASIDAARASIGEVEGIQNKRAATQKFLGQEAVGNAQMRELDSQLAISKADLFRKMSDEQVKFQAKTLADNGQYVAAYLAEYESNYGPTLKRVEADITASTNEENTKRLLGYKDYLAKMKEAGVTAAIGKSLAENFNKDLAEVQAKLSDLANVSGPGAGLGAVFTNAYSAMDEYSQKIETLKAQQASLQSLATANPSNPKLQQDATAELQKLNSLAEQMRAQWVSIGQSIGDSLATAFGKGGAALGGLLNATIDYEAQKDRIEQARQQADDTDPTKAIENQQKATAQLASAQLSAYAKMSGVVKGYFKENTAGYQVASAAEKAFTILQLADALRMFVVKSSFLTGLLDIQVASQAEAAAAEGAYTLSSIAMAGARAAAHGVAAAVSAMVGWPFPLNLIALGATIAAVAALGVNIAGGGGGGAASSMQRQTANGTGLNPDGTLNGGGVLGDPAAKSESIAKSLEAIEKTSGLGLSHTISMDNSLKQLVTGISGLASLLVSGTNLTAPVAGTTKGAAQNLANNALFNVVMGGAVGLLAAGLNKLTGGIGGKITGAIFGGATSVEDVGLKVGSGNLASLMSGANVSQYTDIKKKGGLFSSDKYTTNYTDLGAEVNDQFTKIFQSLYATINAGANILGLGGTAFEEKLKGFVVDIKEISTKGLTGEEVEKALQTALSKLGDDMAKFGVDGLQQFQKVGEGYLETLTRVANDFLQVNDVMSVLGKSFNVTGLAAVTLSENLINAAGGLDKLTENTGYFVENFLTEAEKMAPITKSVQTALSSLGGAGVTTIDQFKQLVLAQNLNTSAGQQTYAALIAIAPQFKEMADYLADLSGVVVKTSAEIRDERKGLQDQLDTLTMTGAQLATKARAAIDPANQALYDLVQRLSSAMSLVGLQGQVYEATGNAAGKAANLELQHQIALQGMSAATAQLTKELWAAQALTAADQAYTNLVSTIESTISPLKQFSKALKDFQTTLDQGDLSTLSPEAKLQAAKSNYEDILARAKAGDQDARSQLPGAAQAFLTADRGYNASNTVYAGDAAKVKSDLAKLASSTDAQIDVAQAQLDEAKKLVEGVDILTDTTERGMAAIATSLANLAASISTLKGATSAVGQTPTQAQTSVVENLYQSILGRKSDAGGLQFWNDALNNGTSLSEVISGFYSSNEYLSTHSHAKGGQAYGMSLVGENGPEMVDFSHPAQVYTANQTAGMFTPNVAASDDNGMGRKIEALQEEARADKIQRALIAEAAAEDARKTREAIDRLARATSRNSSAPRKGTGS